MSTAIEFLNRQLSNLVDWEFRHNEDADSYEKSADAARERAAKCAEQAASVRDAIELLTPKGPRVWDSLSDVPSDVRVLSKGGCPWRHWKAGERHELGHVVTSDPAGGWFWSGSGGYDKQAPFTEILEGEE